MASVLPAIMLVVTIVTGEGKQNISHQEPMPDLQVCLEEARLFLEHRFPDTVDAKALSANCIVKQEAETPS